MTDKAIAFIRALEEQARYRALLALQGPKSPHLAQIEHDLANQEQITAILFGEAVREAELEAINRDWEDIK